MARATQALDALPDAGPADRARLLGIAARALGDPGLLGRWIALIPDEPDGGLRAAMIGAAARIGPAAVPDLDAWVAVLADGVADAESRPAALFGLRALGARPDAAGALAAAVPVIGDRAERDAVVATLALVPEPGPAVAAALRAAHASSGPQCRPLVAQRLLEADALGAPGSDLHPTLADLLSPAEPATARRVAIDHLHDRAAGGVADLATVVASDPDPDCRAAAIEALAARAGQEGVLAPVLGALTADADPAARLAAAIALGDLVDDPAAGPAQAMVDALTAEDDPEAAAALLDGLTGPLAASSEVRAALIAVLDPGMDADWVARAVALLGRSAPTDPGVVDLLGAVLESPGAHTRLREAALGAVAAMGAPGPVTAGLVQRGLAAPEPAVRSWAVAAAVLSAPVPPQLGLLEQAAPLLLDDAVDSAVRLDLARKLAALPAPSPVVAEALARGADQLDGDLALTCRRATDRRATRGGAAIDWEGWLRRADAGTDLAGVFPGAIVHFDEQPDMAARICRAALAPSASDALYSAGVAPGDLLQLLLSRDAVDDEVSRICADQILGVQPDTASADLPIAVLSTNPGWAELSATLDQVLARRPDAPPVLLRRALVAAHGDDAGAAAAVQAALDAAPSGRAAEGALRFLAGNPAWPPARPLIAAAAARPELADDIGRPLLADAHDRAGLGPLPEPAAPQGPGLADG